MWWLYVPLYAISAATICITWWQVRVAKRNRKEVTEHRLQEAADLRVASKMLADIAPMYGPPGSELLRDISIGLGQHAYGIEILAGMHDDEMDTLMRLDPDG